MNTLYKHIFDFQTKSTWALSRRKMKVVELNWFSFLELELWLRGTNVSIKKKKSQILKKNVIPADVAGNHQF